MKKGIIGFLCLCLIAIVLGKTGFFSNLAEAVAGEEISGAEALAGQTVFLKEEPEYYYSQLSEQEKVWYCNIRDILGAMAGKTPLDKSVLGAGCDEKSIEKIFQAVMNDHPELFFVSGYTYSKVSRGLKVTSISFRGDYTMSKEDALEKKEWIESSTKAWCSEITGRDQYTKVKQIYEMVIKKTNYDMEAPDNQNIYSVLVKHASVCQGYAKSIQYLCNEIGMECILVQGKVNTGETHAWNCVKIDGMYYLLDATWGDASYRAKDETKDFDKPDINYDFLNVTNAELADSHIPDKRFPLPECTSTAANYYVRQGTLFRTYDERKLQDFFGKLKYNKNISMKCEDEQCFREMKAALLDRQEIFQYISERNITVAYTTNENQRTLTFWMTSAR